MTEASLTGSEKATLTFVSPTPFTRPAKLISLQYIRAAGALLVVVWHTGWTRTVIGQSGVDLFFVVSGFVMMLVSSREQSPGRFILARLARIVPLYWAVTLVIVYMVEPPAETIISSLLFWPERPFPLIIQGWSLNLEMMYYVMFALSLFGQRRWRVPLLGLQMAVVLIVLPTLFPAYLPLRYLSNPLGVEFLAGVTLYIAWMRGAVPSGARAWLLIVAGVTVLAATHLLGGAPEGWFRVAAWGMPALAIVTGSLGVERSGQLPRIALLETLGEASYSIYLTHVIAIGLVSGSLRHLWAPIAVAIAVPWACAVGWAVYRGFELPLLRLSKRMVRSIWAGQPKPSY